MPSLIQFACVAFMLLWSVCFYCSYEKDRNASYMAQDGVIACIFSGLIKAVLLVIILALVVVLGYVAAGGMG